jgi:hypothetical protein
LGYALWVMRYGICVMGYGLWVMGYGLLFTALPYTGYATDEALVQFLSWAQELFKCLFRGAEAEQIEA